MDFSLLLQDIPTLLVVILGVPAVLAAYIVGGEYLVRRLPDKNRPQVRPWIWVGPALILVAAYLLIPAIRCAADRQHDLAGHNALPSRPRVLASGPVAWRIVQPPQQPRPHRRGHVGHHRLCHGHPFRRVERNPGRAARGRTRGRGRRD